MKDQYFGDVNDFLKYGILRELSKGPWSLQVMWMLTQSDGRTDGKLTEYLSNPKTWRPFDPALFDFLKAEVVDSGRRSVSCIESWKGLPASFFSKIVPDKRLGRQQWSAEVLDSIRTPSVVFFDPDNGIEVKSRPMGRKGSSKYVYWTELLETWERGASLLVYQHFTREPRARFLERLTGDLKQRLGARRVFVFRTSRVAFFLVPQKEWEGRADRHASEIRKAWEGQIKVQEVFGRVSET